MGLSLCFVIAIHYMIYFCTQGGFTCSCPPGYALQSDQKTCKAQRKEKKMCPVMERPPGAFFKCTHRRTKQGYHVGAKCIMKCRRGHQVGTPMRIKCTDTGEWLGGKGECLPATCPPLQPPANGQVEPKSCTEGK